MKLLWRLFILAIFGGIIYALFFGFLIFLNPIKIEYEYLKGERADIYTRDIVQLSPFYYELETDMDQAEKFSGLLFAKRPTIIVTQDKKEFAHFLPWILNSGDLNGVTLRIGNVIYINTEKIRQEKYDEQEVVRHELINDLIAQNSIYLNSFVIDKHIWFTEGVAAYFGGPKYLSDLEFIQKFDEKEPDYDSVSANIFINLSDDQKFNSTLYRLFMKYLIDTYGSDVFRMFINRYLNSPSNFRVVFSEVYDKKMILVIEDFMDKYQNLSR